MNSVEIKVLCFPHSTIIVDVGTVKKGLTCNRLRYFICDSVTILCSTQIHVIYIIWSIIPWLYTRVSKICSVSEVRTPYFFWLVSIGFQNQKNVRARVRFAIYTLKIQLWNENTYQLKIVTLIQKAARISHLRHCFFFSCMGY